MSCGNICTSYQQDLHIDQHHRPECTRCGLFSWNMQCQDLSSRQSCMLHNWWGCLMYTVCTLQGTLCIASSKCRHRTHQDIRRDSCCWKRKINSLQCRKLHLSIFWHYRHRLCIKDCTAGRDKGRSSRWVALQDSWFHMCPTQCVCSMSCVLPLSQCLLSWRQSHSCNFCSLWVQTQCTSHIRLHTWHKCCHKSLRRSWEDSPEHICQSKGRLSSQSLWSRRMCISWHCPHRSDS